MIRILHRSFLFFIITIEGKYLMICIISFSGMFLPFGEEFSRHLLLLHLPSKLKWGNSCSTRFSLDHWVGNDTHTSKFPNLFVLVMDPSATVNTRICLFDEIIIGLSNLEDGHIKTSQMISTISLPYSNLKISTLIRMFDNGSLNKVVSLPLTPFIEA